MSVLSETWSIGPFHRFPPMPRKQTELSPSASQKPALSMPSSTVSCSDTLLMVRPAMSISTMSSHQYLPNFLRAGSGIVWGRHVPSRYKNKRASGSVVVIIVGEGGGGATEAAPELFERKLNEEEKKKLAEEKRKARKEAKEAKGKGWGMKGRESFTGMPHGPHPARNRATA
jgi:hypothetical protein